MSKHSHVALLALCSLTLLSSTSRAEESPPGRLLAAQCAQCHGTDGRSQSGIEGLAGEGSRELLDELIEMKTAPEIDGIMHRQVRGYTDDQLRLIAEYFSMLPSHEDEGDDR